MLEALDGVCASLEGDPAVKVVVLTGAGRAFSAGGGASQRLPRVVGARRAKELMLLGGWLDAAQALQWGLVSRVTPAGGLAVVLDDLARELAVKSGAAAQAVKALVHLGEDVPL